MNQLQLANAARKTSIGLLGALVIYLSLHHILGGQDVLFRWLVSCVPLLAFFPGLMRARFRSGSWLCFVLLIYFIGFTAALWIPGNLWGDALGVFLTVSLFISAMMFARWQQRANIAQANIAQGEPSS